MMEDLSLRQSPKVLNLNIDELSNREVNTLDRLLIGKSVVLISIATRNYKGQLTTNQLFENYIDYLVKTKKLYQLDQLQESNPVVLVENFKTFLNDI